MTQKTVRNWDLFWGLTRAWIAFKQWNSWEATKKTERIVHQIKNRPVSINDIKTEQIPKNLELQVSFKVSPLKNQGCFAHPTFFRQIVNCTIIGSLIVPSNSFKINQKNFNDLNLRLQKISQHKRRSENFRVATFSRPNFLKPCHWKAARRAFHGDRESRYAWDLVERQVWASLSHKSNFYLKVSKEISWNYSEDFVGKVCWQSHLRGMFCFLVSFRDHHTSNKENSAVIHIWSDPAD
jgi:hypothetical protein